MKTLRDYLKESADRAERPAAGDSFTFDLMDEQVIVDTYVLESTDDSVTVAADARAFELLESYEFVLEDADYTSYGDWQQEARSAGATQFRDFSDDGELILHDPEGEWGGKDASYEEAQMVVKGRPTQTIGRWDWDTMTGSLDSTDLVEAEYQGRDVKLNKPMSNTDGKSKSKVYVKDPKTGNVKKVTFGQKGVKIKKNNPERRKSFRARHKCGTAKDKTTARYWSCRAW